VKLMVEIIDDVRKNGFTQEELDKKRNSFLTFHFLGQESVDAQAHALGDAEAGLTWQRVSGFSDAVRLASVNDINEVFKKYNNHISWTYLGNESQVQTGDFPQPKSTQQESDEPQPEATEAESESPDTEVEE
jgi:predicted Zn-dependent peptidase